MGSHCSLAAELRLLVQETAWACLSLGGVLLAFQRSLYVALDMKVFIFTWKNLRCFRA